MKGKYYGVFAYDSKRNYDKVKHKQNRGFFDTATQYPPRHNPKVEDHLSATNTDTNDLRFSINNGENLSSAVENNALLYSPEALERRNSSITHEFWKFNKSSLINIFKALFSGIVIISGGFLIGIPGFFFILYSTKTVNVLEFIIMSGYSGLAFSCSLLAINSGILDRIIDRFFKPKASPIFVRRTGMVYIKSHGNIWTERPFYDFLFSLERGSSGENSSHSTNFLYLQNKKDKTIKDILYLIHDEIGELQKYRRLIEQYMDIARPLPDIPEFEPFRKLDPTTYKWDKIHARPINFYENMSNKTFDLLKERLSSETAQNKHSLQGTIWKHLKGNEYTAFDTSDPITPKKIGIHMSLKDLRNVAIGINAILFVITSWLWLSQA